MSTDPKKRKRRFPRIERIKIVEYGLIAFVVLAFIGLAIYYGSRRTGSETSEAAARTVSPKPTDDRSVRGMHVFSALSDAGFTAATREAGLYDVVSEDGVSFEMRMIPDDKSILTLSFETILSPDLEENTETARVLNAQNKRTLDAIRRLFDCVMPVFHRNAADSETIVKQCQKVVKSGETYAKNLSEYTVRISASSDSETTPKTVVIELIRNQK